jgi:hypothetical protein
MKPLYIFDLDGTLALIEHRRHFVDGYGGSKKDWPAFFRACVDDKPNHRVIETLRQLATAGADIWVWSGRSNEVARETYDWLITHVPGECIAKIKMRAAGDHQPDTKLKSSWLKDMRIADRLRLVAVFDDRDSVVAMWRENGVSCFQVAPGDF